MPKEIKKINFTQAVGRRKSATARVRIYKGKGKSSVNGLAPEKYFPNPLAKDVWLTPFEIIDQKSDFFFSAKIIGGGKKGQLKALTLAIARSLAKLDKEYGPLLKKAGLLTRDARIRERRKVGMGGKSRRKRQSPKR